jgi:XapX domain-containing protein
MKTYLMSLAAGLLVGVIYNLLTVRSPAPPVVALVGLLGILLGEQAPPLVRSLWLKEPLARAWFHQIQPHVFGLLPQGGKQLSPQVHDASGRRASPNGDTSGTV